MEPVVLVSGGTYGIGRAITLALAGSGYRVVAFGLDRQVGSIADNGVEDTRAALSARGIDAELLEGDVSRAKDVSRIVDHMLARFGRVDALVNNAAIHPRGTILDTTPEVWDRVLAVNLTGAFYSAKAVIPHMITQGGGSILNIGSGAQWGKQDLLAYSASKGGLYALTMALARDHLRQHIRVNMLVPGPTQTGMTGGAMATPNFVTAANATVTGDLVQPDEVAAAVSFLLSPAARQISGTVLDVGALHHQGGPVIRHD